MILSVLPDDFIAIEIWQKERIIVLISNDDIVFSVKWGTQATEIRHI